jgi:hypothetical protein
LQLKQFGENEGCYKQIDRLRELEKLFRVSGNHVGKAAKRARAEMQAKKLKNAQMKTLITEYK